MKYLLIMQFPLGEWKTSRIETWPARDIQANMAFMQDLSAELLESGELIHTAGLNGPEAAVMVSAGNDGVPEITDGPFPETKEFLAGFWIVDVVSAQRAHELAARVSAMPGPGGKPSHLSIEVRPVMGHGSCED